MSNRDGVSAPIGIIHCGNFHTNNFHTNNFHFELSDCRRAIYPTGRQALNGMHNGFIYSRTTAYTRAAMQSWKT
jgi:hypothetical protein